jgi:glycosyltransferase involved in cell wall biosynthesis
MAAKKILINAVSSKMGGALSYLKNLVGELERVDFENEYLVCVSPAIAGQLKTKRIRIIVKAGLGDSHLKRIYWDQLGIRRLIKKEKIDILFYLANFATLFCPVKQLLLIRGYLLTTPYFKETIFAKYSRKKKMIFYLRQFLIRLSVQAADRVMFPSQSTFVDFEKMISFPKKKPVVNRYGTYLEKFRGKRPAGEGKSGKAVVWQLLYATMYSERKNFSTLFLALDILKKRGFDFRLITPAVFNDRLAEATPTCRQDLELLARTGLKERIVLTGKLPYERIDELYKQADIFLWPTLVESFGHPLIEAMASGLPIVASDIPINREIAGRSALYFQPLNPEDLAAKISLVLNDGRLRQKLALESRKRSELFRWEDYVKRLILIFKGL